MAFVLLQNTTVFIAEVMGRDVADRLTTWQRLGLNTKTRFVVHDFLPLTHSRFFSPASSHEHLLNVEAFAASEQITVATPLLEAEVRAFCTAIDLPAPPIDVVPLPIASALVTKTISPKPSNPYVVFMGGFESRKRLSEFVEYVLAHRASNDAFTVVIVGTPPVITDRHQYELVSSILNNRDIFRLKSGLTDSELAVMMAEALAVVYVSDAEGYGLPVLEALALGTPVITTSNALNSHLKSLYGGVLDVFDESNAAIATIRSLSKKAHRSSIVSTIRRDALPHDVDAWAAKITAALATR
jgi:glycosyltransferase involved in cell wall biosynthesis